VDKKLHLLCLLDGVSTNPMVREVRRADLLLLLIKPEAGV
jgi:hypothetical protein